MTSKDKILVTLKWGVFYLPCDGKGDHAGMKRYNAGDQLLVTTQQFDVHRSRFLAEGEEMPKVKPTDVRRMAKGKNPVDVRRGIVAAVEAEPEAEPQAVIDEVSSAESEAVAQPEPVAEPEPETEEKPKRRGRPRKAK